MFGLLIFLLKSVFFIFLFLLILLFVSLKGSFSRTCIWLQFYLGNISYSQLQLEIRREDQDKTTESVENRVMRHFRRVGHRNVLDFNGLVDNSSERFQSSVNRAKVERNYRQNYHVGDCRNRGKYDNYRTLRKDFGDYEIRQPMR